MFRVVATEKACVDDDATNDAWKTESNDAPVKPRRPASSALPTIHPLATIGVFVRDKNRRTGLQQILLGRKKIIIRHNNRATQSLRRKIDQFSKIHN